MSDLKRLIVSFMAVLISWGLILWSTELTAYYEPLDLYLDHYLLRMLLVMISLAIQVYLLYALSKWNLKVKLTNYCTTLLTVLILLTVLEGVFTWVPQSNRRPSSLASRNWFFYYWETNELGYRDNEILEVDGDQDTNVMVLGDSYVAGHGLKHPANRFSNILQTLLPEDHKVYNLGKNGANTLHELENLRSYPIEPDVLIFSHYVNDIIYLEQGKTAAVEPIAPKYLEADVAESYLISHSYLLNFAYWKGLAIFTRVGPWLMSQLGYSAEEVNELSGNSIYGLYNDYYRKKDLLNQHLQTLQMIIDHCAAKEIKLMLLLFPHSSEYQLDHSEQYVNQPLDSFFQVNKVPVVNTYPILKQLPYNERIVSHVDTHPSIKVNDLVAKVVYLELQKNGFIEKKAKEH